jgi:hypothetical protein
MVVARPTVVLEMISKKFTPASLAAVIAFFTRVTLYTKIQGGKQPLGFTY